MKKKNDKNILLFFHFFFIFTVHSYGNWNGIRLFLVLLSKSEAHTIWNQQLFHWLRKKCEVNMNREQPNVSDMWRTSLQLTEWIKALLWVKSKGLIRNKLSSVAIWNTNMEILLISSWVNEKIFRLIWRKWYRGGKEEYIMDYNN